MPVNMGSGEGRMEALLGKWIMRGGRKGIEE